MMQQSVSFQQQQKMGRVKLLAIVALFVLPVLAAQIILSNNLYRSGVTNQGTLITPYLHYGDFWSDDEAQPDYVTKQSRWHLLYLAPTQCLSDCQRQLELLQATHQLVGKDKSRVTPYALTSNPNSVNSITGVVSETEIGVLPIPHYASLKEGDIVIVDRLGQWVMSFSAEDFESLDALHYALLSDLKKLLKLSRVG